MTLQGGATGGGGRQPGAWPFADVPLPHPYIPGRFQHPDLPAQDRVGQFDGVAHELEFGFIDFHEGREDAEPNRSIEMLVEAVPRVRYRCAHRDALTRPAAALGCALAES